MPHVWEAFKHEGINSLQSLGNVLAGLSASCDASLQHMARRVR